ncbi:MAG TPA: OmpA family protein [Kofleriaceae bacterium]|jgi:OOP family OmpA-OmpF porin|nr:OmpA family protein [Kofleriaceae bacterium]
MHLLELAVGRGTPLVLALGIASWFARPTEPPEEPRRVVVTETTTTILDVVEFAPGTATLRPASKPTLDAVASTLIDNPSIELVEVQSHTRGSGNEDANLALSEQRAASIVTYLVHAGVPPSRLTAQGYGDTQPVARAGAAKNERVSFLIIKRSP